jgi:GTPase
MNFIDVARIEIKAGDGGKGHISFRREKYVPKGGPDGGNGGDGGSVIARADRHLGTLLDFSYKRHFTADAGDPGGRNRRAGKSGEDLIIKVPCGTVIRNADTGEQIADLEQDGDSIIIAQGGRGGKGNSEYATSTNQTPRFAQPGTPGEVLTVELELKLLADVGLVGFPNAGKSTLISAISAAKPKIADYPFTTLVPNLGMVRAGEGRSFTVADIPGLIEGASAGKGLGQQFLRHIERTSVLVYLIDCTSEDPDADLATLKHELREYDAALLDKASIVCLSKGDLLSSDDQETLEHHDFTQRQQARLISAVSHIGLEDLIHAMWKHVETTRSAPSE